LMLLDGIIPPSKNRRMAEITDVGQVLRQSAGKRLRGFSSGAIRQA
jgi:hypothetical protein